MEITEELNAKDTIQTRAAILFSNAVEACVDYAHFLEIKKFAKFRHE